MPRSSVSVPWSCRALGLALVPGLLVIGCARRGAPVADPTPTGGAANGPALAAPAAAPVETTAPPDGSQCDEVVSKLSEPMETQMTGSLPADKATKWITRLREVLVASCREDGWPAEVTRCVLAATDQKAVDTCGAHMTGDEVMEEKMMKRMQPLMDEMMKDLMGGMEQGAAGGDPAPPTP